MSSEVMLRLENVSKTYNLYARPSARFLGSLFPALARGKAKTFTALEPLSLEIKRGECVGVMGINGSGKSTLLQMIAGTVTPSTGKIYAKGQITSLLELGGWIDATLSGRENIYNAGYTQGLTTEEINEQLTAIVEFAEIGEFIEQPVSSYSTGMVMRLAFAASIYLNSEILLLDEIFAVGDAHFARKCISLLRSKIATSTVLIVSHDTNVITSLCNRAILLEHGHLVLDAAPHEVTERYLEGSYSTRQHVQVSAVAHPVSHDGCDLRHPTQRPSVTMEEFNAAGRAFGEGGAEILEIYFTGIDGNRTSMFKGGEMLTLHVRARALKNLLQAAVGFSVRSPSGVVLFGDVVSDLEGVELEAGGVVKAEFTFIMPLLPDGDYSVGASVSTGPLAGHKIQIWHHNAVIFTVSGGIPVLGVLFGMPMKGINFYHE